MIKQAITQQTPPVEFVVNKHYQGPKHVEVVVALYSRNFLLKALRVRSEMTMVIDVDMCVVKFIESEGEKAIDKNILRFKDIESMKLGLKKSHSGCYYLHIKMDDGSKVKIKFFMLSEFQLAIDALRGVETQGGKPLMIVDSKYLNLKEIEKKHKEEISSEEDDDHHVKQNTCRGIHEDPEAVLKRQETDEEYAYLKWKYIDKFEPDGSSVPPENLKKFQNYHEGGEEKDKELKNIPASDQTTLQKSFEIPATSVKEVDKKSDYKTDQKSNMSEGQRTEMSPDLKLNGKVEGFHEVKNDDEESPVSQKKDIEHTIHTKKILHTDNIHKATPIPQEGSKSNLRSEDHTRSG
jgi:hypothetical protein